MKHLFAKWFINDNSISQVILDSPTENFSEVAKAIDRALDVAGDWSLGESYYIGYPRSIKNNKLEMSFCVNDESIYCAFLSEDENRYLAEKMCILYEKFMSLIKDRHELSEYNEHIKFIDAYKA